MEIYYEDHGRPDGRPLVLIHGALSGIGTSFGMILPLLAKDRRVLAVELQAHGHTPDAERPLTVEHCAADVVELLDRLGVPVADVFGWSLGAAIALRLGTDHGDRVGGLVLASVSVTADGLHPGLLDGVADLAPEHLHGSELHEEYLRTAPDPAGFAGLVTKVTALDASPPEWTPAELAALTAPVLLVFGDADIVRPEHVVELFRLLGGGVPGDVTALPACRLAILPGTTHTMVPQRAEWLAAMIDEFLESAPTTGQP
ncbi:alpha/beta fold hydrolase [Cryptosporangium aurantiacum]|uniref:Pimeloyl-ACP methyl ester carboxylesterase n=1 Tax=Cryptosporangium aurantiacum TaxID=134849 RepID=A0A1M7TXT2_9ACTN|nr:alpha/beta hydrolase [Cryptosporangium aurantiacum]SHN75487.1 Pimeloyl-ACP methyl ester carboxylesterase [Cryptosporangium aurantiacum]